MRSNTHLASRLRRRITIEQPSLITDGAGGYTTSWSSFAQVWAEVVPQDSVETFKDEQISAVKKLGLIIRYLEGVTTDMRIVFGARVYNIRSVLNPYEENVLLEIIAET